MIGRHMPHHRFAPALTCHAATTAFATDTPTRSRSVHGLFGDEANVPHVSICISDTDRMTFSYQDGKFDVLPVTQ